MHINLYVHKLSGLHLFHSTCLRLFHNTLKKHIHLYSGKLGTTLLKKTNLNDYHKICIKCQTSRTSLICFVSHLMLVSQGERNNQLVAATPYLHVSILTHIHTCTDILISVVLSNYHGSNVKNLCQILKEMKVGLKFVLHLSYKQSNRSLLSTSKTFPLPSRSDFLAGTLLAGITTKRHC